MGKKEGEDKYMATANSFPLPGCILGNLIMLVSMAIRRGEA